MTEHGSVEHLLASLAKISTRFRPKDSELINIGRLLADFFAKLPAENREAISRQVSPDLRKKLMAISAFMVEEALNTKDVRWLRDALLVQLIDDFSGDYREGYRYLVLINYAAEKNGESMSSLVTSVMPLASAHSAEFLKTFLGRDKQLNRLSSFGVTEFVVDGRSQFTPI